MKETGISEIAKMPAIDLDLRGLAKLALPGFLLVTGSFPVAAQVTLPQEYDKTINVAGSIASLGEDLFGDRVDLYTGAASFESVDVSLAGSNDLPVEIRRKYSVESRTLSERSQLLARDGGFSDWELFLPHLKGVFAEGRGWQVGDAGSDQRCLHGLGAAPVVDGSPAGSWDPAEYWHGNHLVVPDEGSNELLALVGGNPNQPTSGGPYLWATKSNWFFSCLAGTANGVVGDAFLAHDPKGNLYWFDWIVSRPAPSIIKSYGAPIDVGRSAASSGRNHATAAAAAPGSETTALVREEVLIFPTKVQDRFGNYVTYTYDQANPWHLTSINSSDGRSLTVTYNTSGHVATVSAGTRTWQYVYGNGLEQVLLPDNGNPGLSRWLIDFSNLREAFTTPETGISLMCERSGASNGQAQVSGTLTHPSGAVGVFTFKSITHGRSYVPKNCIRPNPNDAATNFAWTPYLFNQISITSKQITNLSGGAVSTWSYSYGPTNHSWESSCGSGCLDYKTVEVVGPGGEWSRFTYGNRFRLNEGQLRKTERGSGPSLVMMVEEQTYQNDPNGLSYPARIGESTFTRGDFMFERLNPIKKRETRLGAMSYVWEVSQSCGTGSTLCFDQFARPTKVIESSAPLP